MWRSSPLKVAARNASTSVRASDGPITRGAQTQHVEVVVLDRLPRRVGVVTDGGANARKFARRDRRARAAAAHQDAAVGLPVADGLWRPPRRCRGSPPAAVVWVPRSVTSCPCWAR